MSAYREKPLNNVSDNLHYLLSIISNYFHPQIFKYDIRGCVCPSVFSNLFDLLIFFMLPSVKKRVLFYILSKFRSTKYENDLGKWEICLYMKITK